MEYVMHNNENKETKLVFNMGVARKLLKAGCTIVDLKPNRDNRDKTVAVFKNDGNFMIAFEQLNREIAESKGMDKSE